MQEVERILHDEDGDSEGEGGTGRCLPSQPPADYNDDDASTAAVDVSALDCLSLSRFGSHVHRTRQQVAAAAAKQI